MFDMQAAVTAAMPACATAATPAQAQAAYAPVQGAFQPPPLLGAGKIAAPALAAAQAYSNTKGGTALLVWRKGRLAYEAYAPGCSATTLFDTFSMAKSVLGLVYGGALRDGVIRSLDQPVSDYLPEWRGDPRGEITLRNLLSMESGLKLYSLARKDPQALALLSGPDVAALALATPLARPPRQSFEYANVNSEIAGLALSRALERAGRGTYAEYLSKVLWTPLKQEDAVLGLDHANGTPRYFAGLKATARDWMRLGVLIAGDGRIDDRQVLPKTWIRMITTPSPRNANYGLQVWIGTPFAPHRSYGRGTPLTATASAPYLARDLVFFDGAGGQRVYVSPSLHLVIVRIGAPDWSFDDAVIPNLVVEGLH